MLLLLFKLLLLLACALLEIAIAVGLLIGIAWRDTSDVNYPYEFPASLLILLLVAAFV